MIPSNIPFLATALTLSASFALADLPESYPCDTVCVSVFRSCRADEDGCTKDTPTYPMLARNEEWSPKMVFPDYEYRIEWRGADPQYPVRLYWSFPSSDDDTRPTNETVRWEHNITAGEDSGTFIWTPRTSLANFPTSLSPNITADEAFVLASTSNRAWNHIGVSQPGSPVEDEEHPIAWSDAFTLAHNRIETFLVAQNEIGHRDEMKKWRLGVGIAVGVGGMVLIVGSAVMGYKWGKREGETGKYQGVGVEMGGR